ncbi:MAG: NAD(P)-dependent oxidoreductase [Steroidobacterales bacterium]
MQAVYLDYDSVSYADLDPAPLLDVLPGLKFAHTPADDEVAGLIRDAEIILVNKTRLTRERMIAAPLLRLIVCSGTGTDNVDLAAARERGIAVCNVVDYCTTSVAQHTWSLILCLTQRLFEYRRAAVDGSWASGVESRVRVHDIRELTGRTLGIVGWGNLGRAVAAIAPAFGMQVVIANRTGAAPAAGRVQLKELLTVADVVSLHCPLNDATRGLIGTAELALMKRDALLINTARGGLVDAPALALALREGRIGGAGIDVLAREPPIDGNPLLDPEIPNLIVTPHVAWGAREARQRCLAEMAANIREFLGRRRRNRVV